MVHVDRSAVTPIVDRSAVTQVVDRFAVTHIKVQERRSLRLPRRSGVQHFFAVALAAALLLAGAPGAHAQQGQRTQFRPGWNIFSPQQDVQVGQKAAQDAEKKLPLCHDPKVDAYLTQLGKRLAAKAPTGGVQYPYEFHCVNDKAINAFALPGGYVFVNRGTIEAADNEAQLAAVMAHELSHVALRHGTSQASKAQAASLPIAILGGILGGSAMGSLVTQLGAFSVGSVLLKYSRTAETQADVMGTQILYDAGYDPRAMAQFFEKLEAESKGKNPPEFFSDHPSPEHRVERVDEEIDRLGGPPPSARRDSAEFQAIRHEVLALPVAPAAKDKRGAPGGAAGKPAAPSGRYADYQGSAFSLKYPDNWKKYGEGHAVSLAPDGGVVQDRNGQDSLAYGMIISVADPHGDPNAANALEESTGRLLDELQHANSGMRIARQPQRVRLNGQRALSTYLSNDSPLGGQETDWIITVLRPEGLLYFICVAPERDYANYDSAFVGVLDSVRFPR
ncbi:MAG: M48 family metalloprotease [Acidobacteriia bacterium]|nr:M48 family metalloprotease [Terriglobia bacterium]